jgi:hypothetical protein
MSFASFGNDERPHPAVAIKPQQDGRIILFAGSSS